MFADSRSGELRNGIFSTKIKLLRKKNVNFTHFSPFFETAISRSVFLKSVSNSQV